MALDINALARGLTAVDNPHKHFEEEIALAIVEFKEKLELFHSLQAQLTAAQEELDEFVSSHMDNLGWDILNDAQPVLTLNIESSTVSAYNEISEAHGMYFYTGTDREPEGPWPTLESIFADIDYFDLEYDSDAFIEILSREVPDEILWPIVESKAPDSGDQITLNGQTLQRRIEVIDEFIKVSD